MKRIILIYSIDEFKEYETFVTEHELEQFVNDKNEYTNTFELIDCYYIGEEIVIKPEEIVTKYFVVKE
jgi:hypothetical protein